MNPKTLVHVVGRTFREWSADKAPRLGAALAYYGMFSLAPLLIIAVGIAGLVFGEEAARGELARELGTVVSAPVAEGVQDLVQHTRRAGTGWLATVVGFGTLLFGAAGLFWQLQDALDTVWKVVPKEGRGLLGVVRDRVFSFALVLGIGFLLLASLALNTSLVVLSGYLPAVDLPAGISLWHGLNALVSVLVITLLFALIFKVLPDVNIPWREVWTGSALTALLFIAGRHLLSLYLGYAGVATAFGAAGSLVLILFWIYYSAQIFLFGAEFIRVYAEQRGSLIVPRANARRLTAEDCVRQGMP